MPRYLALAVNCLVLLSVKICELSLQPDTPGLAVWPGSGPRTSTVSVCGFIVAPLIVLLRPNPTVPHTYTLSSLVCTGPFCASPSWKEISFEFGQPEARRTERTLSAHLAWIVARVVD